MKEGMANYRFIVPAEIHTARAVEILSEEEKQRANRFHFPKDAIHWKACRAGLREILGELTGLPPDRVPLLISEKGKPLLAAPFAHLHFNLSHCDDLAVVAWSTDGPVGVDVESLRRGPDLLECVTTFCHPLEIAGLPTAESERANQLLKIWTAKEAVLKSLGTGFFTAPETLRIDFQQTPVVAVPDMPISGLEKQKILEIRHPLAQHQIMISVAIDSDVEIG